MRKFVYFLVSAVFLSFQSVTLEATCPATIDPLPALPLPIVVPPPSSTCTTPTPPSQSGYLPITIVNNSGLSADEIYISVLVNSTTQYLSFDSSSLATISDFTKNTYLSDPEYSYTLSSFLNYPSSSDNFTFYIPNTGKDGDPTSNFMKSSRILISLKKPLTYFIDNTGLLNSPSEFDVLNDNYYILNDKVEYDLGSNNLNRLNLNLTWVDFFGLPMSVQANYQFFYGGNYTPYCAFTGMPSDISLDDVFTKYNTAINSVSSPLMTYWGSLVASYTNPPSSSDLCKLRIFAPATAMGSSQTQSNPSSVSFPTNYFLSSATSELGCTWFDAVWFNTVNPQTAYYQKNNPVPYLVVDATTTNGAGTAKGYETNTGDFVFTISGDGVDNAKTVIISKPTSSKAFFTGAVSDYTPAISGTASSLAFAQIFKVFATSIISGILPFNCQFPDPVVLDSTYVQNHASEYFANNTILNSYLSSCSCVSNHPWYDFYSRTLLTIGTPHLFYTSAYSDFLGADGTIVITSLDSENQEATITITLGDCSTNINFPDPFLDSTLYTVYVNPPADSKSNSLATVLYSTSESGPFSAITSPMSNVSGSQVFLQVTYNSTADYPTDYNGLTFVTQVAPSASITTPILPGAANISTTGTTTTISIGAPPRKPS
jgi:hypothetical protein